VSAEALIRHARARLVRTTFARGAGKGESSAKKSLEKPESPLTDSNRRPPSLPCDFGGNRWQAVTMRFGLSRRFLGLKPSNRLRLVAPSFFHNLSILSCPWPRPLHPRHAEEGSLISAAPATRRLPPCFDGRGGPIQHHPSFIHRFLSGRTWTGVQRLAPGYQARGRVLQAPARAAHSG
jgi:hypothetical protein